MPHWHSLTSSPPGSTAPFRVGRAVDRRALSAVRQSRVHSDRPRPGRPHAVSESTGLYYRVGTTAGTFKLAFRIGPAVVLYCPTLSRPGSQAALSQCPATDSFKFASHHPHVLPLRGNSGFKSFPGRAAESRVRGDTVARRRWTDHLGPGPMGTRVAPARRTPAKPPCLRFK